MLAPPTLNDYRSRAPSPARQSGGRRSGTPRVSVVTIVRNGASAIEETIRSVLSQTGVSFEYVVVDGGSTDGTVDIIRRYGDQLGAWISEPDKGISDAFNKGIALAKGDVVGILNAGDTYEAGALAASVATLDAHPEAGFCFGGCAYLEGKRVAFTIQGDPNYTEAIDRRMPDVNHPTVFVRRSVYEQYGLFCTEYRLAMDYDLLLRLHRAGVRGVAVPKVIARMPLEGASNRQIFRTCREARDIALSHGSPRLAVLGEYAYRVTGHVVAQGLHRLGADGVIRRLRALRFRTLEQ